MGCSGRIAVGCEIVGVAVPSRRAGHGGARVNEARLARDIAKTLKRRGWNLTLVRLNVRGGETDPAQFDHSLRLSLASEMPEEARSVNGLEIRRVPFGHVCPGCGKSFEAAQIAAECPGCHAESLPVLTEEEIEVERLERVR